MSCAGDHLYGRIPSENEQLSDSGDENMDDACSCSSSEESLLSAEAPPYSPIVMDDMTGQEEDVQLLLPATDNPC